MKARVKKTGEVIDIFACEEQQKFGVIYTPQYFASELDFNVEDERTIIFDGWVAKDDKGNLYMYNQNPTTPGHVDSIKLPTQVSPDVTLDIDTPKEVSVIIKIK